jgi:hypothetical protein
MIINHTIPPKSFNHLPSIILRTKQREGTDSTPLNLADLTQHSFKSTPILLKPNPTQPLFNLIPV